MNTEISILVPVYNVEKYVGKCLKSIFESKVIEISEIIIVNDCSTDNSLDEIYKVLENYSQYKNSVKIINNSKNLGIGKVRQILMNNSSGRYIVFVDSDDWIESDYLSSLYQKAIESNADIVCCDFTYRSEFDKIKPNISRQNIQKDGNQCLIDLYNDKIGAYLWIKFFKKDFLTIHNIQFSPDVNLWEDMLFSTKCFVNNPRIEYIPKPLYNYLKRENSYLNTGICTLKKADSFFFAIKNIEDYLKTNKCDFALDSFYRCCAGLKSDCIFSGEKSVQKKYLNVYPVFNKYLDNNNRIKFKRRIILKISSKHSKLAYFLIVVFSLLKVIFRKLDFKEYWK